MNKTKKTAIAIVVAALAVTAVVGFGVWFRREANSRPSPTPSVEAPKSDSLPPSLAATAARTATDFEANARQWGVGRFDLREAQGLPIGQAVTRWRVSDDGGLPARKAALEPLVGDSVQLHDPQEKDPSWDGASLYHGYADYWSKQLYTIGVNLEPDGVKVTSADRSSDGTITVKVTTRQQVVVYTPPAAGDTAEGSWTFSPSIGYYDSQDRLRLSEDGTKVVQLPDGNLSGPWFLSPLVHGWKKADSGFTGLAAATERHDQSVTYRGDDFRNAQTGLYPDPLFFGSGSTAQQPAPEGTGKKTLAPGELPPEG